MSNAVLLQTSIIRHAMYVSARTGNLSTPPNHLAIKEGPGIKAIWVDPVPDQILGSVASWAAVAGVKPARIPGYWLDQPGADIPVGQKPVPGEKVVYCLHGGAYTQLSAHPSDPTANIAKGILQHCKNIQRAFSIEYRLSSLTPYETCNPFPTALIDALAGYNYLIHTVGFDPSDIIIEGDSAGGNLALALTRYLVEYPGTSLPAPPSSIILLSPWADIGTSHDGPKASIETLTMDYLGSLDSKRGRWSREAFVGPHGMGAADNNRYISPASKSGSVNANFKGFPRTFLVAGGAERLYDSIVTLKEKMVKDMGEGTGPGQVTYYFAPDAVHDYIPLLWHEPERTETLKAIADWV